MSSWPTPAARRAAIEFLRGNDKARLARDTAWLAALCQALGQSGRGEAKELRARIDVQAGKFLRARIDVQAGKFLREQEGST